MSQPISEFDLHNAVRSLSSPKNAARFVRNALTLGDGTKLSVQASSFHYCTPREDALSAYESYEVAIIGEKLEYDPEAPFAERADSPSEGCVYAYVPASEIVEYINQHGGIV